VTNIIAPVLVVMLGAIAGCSAALAAVPVERFVDKAATGRPDISPNGRFLAVPKRQGNGMGVFVVDLEAPKGTPPVVIPAQDVDIEWVRWANDTRLLISFVVDVDMKTKIGSGRMSRKYDTASVRRIVSVDRDGRNIIGLMTPDRRFRANWDLSVIAHMLPDAEDEILMAANDPQSKYDLYRVNVKTGALQEVAAGERRTDSWLTDVNGVARVRWDYNWDDDAYEVYLRRGDSDAWDKVFEYGERETAVFRVVGFTDDPKVAIVASGEGGDKLALYEYDIVARKMGRMLFSHPSFDIGSPFGQMLYDPWTSRLLGFTYAEDLWRVHYFDGELTQIQASADDAFPDSAVVHMLSWSKDRRRVILYTEGPKDPGSYYLLDRAAKKSELLARRSPQLPASELGDIAIIKYAARDGVKISGYLTMPPGRGDKKLPMVVLPHGGPEVRDTVEYDMLAQSIANAGYLVFQPNFRGSGGYGRTFAEAGHRQWGRRMQDDITDGVKALIADGTADANRICIVGASYGGYAALAGGAFTPELYKCVVSIAGVSDLPEIVRGERENGRETSVFRYWVKRIGHPERDEAEMKAWSPAAHADKFAAPVLLIHGEWDATVPFDQSLIMERALNRAGKKVQLVRVRREGHVFDDPGTPLILVSEVRKFLMQHLGQ
jgi:dipeptidyl aminopeptidase/acylaminoacyl peptidase